MLRQTTHSSNKHVKVRNTGTSPQRLRFLMTRTTQSSAQATLPPARLTIMEAVIQRSPVLGSSKIYRYAAAGAVLGILLSAAIAAIPWIPANFFSQHPVTRMSASNVPSAAR